MTSEAGWSSQESDDARSIQEVLNELRQMPQPPRWVTRPEARAALARALRHRTDRLGSL